MPLIYSLDRVRRLRLVLGVDVLAGVLVVGLGVLAASDREFRTFGVVVAGVGLLVLAVSVLAITSLDRRDRRAKVTATAAGVMTLLASPVFTGVIILTLAMIMIGLVITVLALLRDDPELVT